MARLDRPRRDSARLARWDIALGAGVFAVSFGLLVLRFLVTRPVGLTDNGDGWRLTCQVGAFDRRVDDVFVDFAYHGTGECSEVVYPASQVWFARIAQWIGHLIGTESVLNVVIIGLVCCVFAAAGIAAVVVGLPFALRYRLIAAALIWLLVADSAYFGYFASVVTEGAAFIGIVLTVGGLLLMFRDGGWRYTGAAVTAFGGIIAVNAKPQTLIILPALLVVLLFVRRQGRTRLARWALPAAVFVVVGGATAYVQAGASPEGTSGTNIYHAVFNTILDGQHDTQADLAGLGLPPSFEQYVGSRVWSAKTAHKDPLWPRYKDKFSKGNLARYYLTHPVRTTQIFDRSATDLLTARADYQGSFAEEAGFPPITKEYRVPVISGLMRAVAPLGLFFLLPVWVLTCWAGIRACRRGRPEIGVVLLFVLSLALPQFVLAALGEGIENVKHQVIAGFCTGFAGVLAVISLFPRRPAEQEEEQHTEPELVVATSASTEGT